MARTPFQVEVLTPEGEVFNDEVEMVSTKTTVGSIGLLANHQPLLAMLDPTELRLYKSESDVVRFAQGEGFLQVAGTHALVLVDEAFAIENLDTGDLRSRLERAEQALSSAEEGTEEHRAAARDKRRYEAFLKIAETDAFPRSRPGGTVARSDMDYRILGPLEVAEADRLVVLGGADQRSLLALLLLHANEVVSSERLIDELWGESPLRPRTRRVQVYVSQLRKALRNGEPEGPLLTREARLCAEARAWRAGP